MMESQAGTVAGPRTDDELVRIADELLEQTRELRRQHEELREALAGIRVVDREELEAAEAEADEQREEQANGSREKGLHAIVLQMALAGHTREEVREQLATLGAGEADELVEEVFSRVEADRPSPKKRLFARRG